MPSFSWVARIQCNAPPFGNKNGTSNLLQTENWESELKMLRNRISVFFFLGYVSWDVKPLSFFIPK